MADYEVGSEQLPGTGPITEIDYATAFPTIAADENDWLEQHDQR